MKKKKYTIQKLSFTNAQNVNTMQTANGTRRKIHKFLYVLTSIYTQDTSVD